MQPPHVHETLAELLAELYGEVPATDAPLELDSFTLVELLESLERTLGVVITPADLTPENFETIDAITQLIERKRGEP